MAVKKTKENSRVNTKKKISTRIVDKKKVTKKLDSKNTTSKEPTPKKPLKKKKNIKKVTSSKYKGEEAFLASVEPYKLSKKERYMSAKQKNHFDKILERWKQMLQLEQDRTADKIQSVSSHFADEADRATHEEGFTLEIKTRERERKLLSKIDQSIEDIDSGKYGFCINPHCGVEIGIRRLEARPTASLCIDCKTLEEITEKQQYG